MSDAPERIWALADRRKHWQDTPPEDGQHVWHWQEYVRADRIAALEEENKRLREALRWYAEKSNWKRHHIVPKMPCQAVYDSGERARAALEGE
jgi:hypothetical protein